MDSDADEGGVHWVLKRSNQQFYVKPTKLISEVEVRPALYTPEHPDRLMVPDYKNLLWREIAQRLVTTWNDLSKIEQSETIIELQKKWRNIKDCFRKEYKLRKQRHPNVKIKRKYIYFNKLLFLKPTIENQVTESTSKKMTLPKVRRKRNVMRNVEDHETYDPGPSNENQTADSGDNCNVTYEYANKSNGCMVTEDYIDEDKTFLLSLVPSFKRMSTDQKLTAKVEILNVLRNLHMTQYYNGDGVNANPINTDDSEEFVYAETSSRRKRNSKMKMEIEKLDSDTSSE